MTNYKEMREKMAKAPRRGKRVYMKPGQYIVEVLRTERKMAWNENFTARTREMFICEFKILKSSNPDHEEGSTSSWTCKDPTSENGGASDVKAFAMALQGIDPATVRENDHETQNSASTLAYALMGFEEAFEDWNATHPDIPIKEGFQVGERLSLECSSTTTKIGNPFTVHTWSPAPDNS